MDKERELQIIQRTKRCRHYSMKSLDKICALGINIRELVGGDDIGWATRLPCHVFSEAKNGQRAVCESCSPWTTDEAAEQIDKEEAFFTSALVAIEAAHKDALDKGLGMPSRKDPNLKSGHSELDCPVCKEGKIRYTVSQVNGHMHACCTTKECVRWME